MLRLGLLENCSWSHNLLVFHGLPQPPSVKERAHHNVPCSECTNATGKPSQRSESPSLSPLWRGQSVLAPPRQSRSPDALKLPGQTTSILASTISMRLKPAGGGASQGHTHTHTHSSLTHDSETRAFDSPNSAQALFSAIDLLVTSERWETAPNAKLGQFDFGADGGLRNRSLQTRKSGPVKGTAACLGIRLGLRCRGLSCLQERFMRFEAEGVHREMVPSKDWGQYPKTSCKGKVKRKMAANIATKWLVRKIRNDGQTGLLQVSRVFAVG